MTKESYLRYLRSPHWRAFKQRYFKTYEYKCSVCSARHFLELHHLRYRDRFGRSILGREKLTDCVYLCPKHHEDVTKKRIEIVKVRYVK